MQKREKLYDFTLDYLDTKHLKQNQKCQITKKGTFDFLYISMLLNTILLDILDTFNHPLLAILACVVIYIIIGIRYTNSIVAEGRIQENRR